jgi:hypothetical protein
LCNRCFTRLPLPQAFFLDRFLPLLKQCRDRSSNSNITTAATFTNNLPLPPNATFFNPNPTTNQRTEQWVDSKINALLVKMYVYAAKPALLPVAAMQLQKN